MPCGQILTIQTRELYIWLFNGYVKFDICGNVAVQFAATLIYPWKFVFTAYFECSYPLYESTEHQGINGLCRTTIHSQINTSSAVQGGGRSFKDRTL